MYSCIYIYENITYIYKYMFFHDMYIHMHMYIHMISNGQLIGMSTFQRILLQERCCKYKIEHRQHSAALFSGGD